MPCSKHSMSFISTLLMSCVGGRAFLAPLLCVADDVIATERHRGRSQDRYSFGCSAPVPGQVLLHRGGEWLRWRDIYEQVGCDYLKRSVSDSCLDFCEGIPDLRACAQHGPAAGRRGGSHGTGERQDNEEPKVCGWCDSPRKVGCKRKT